MERKRERTFYCWFRNQRRSAMWLRKRTPRHDIASPHDMSVSSPSRPKNTNVNNQNTHTSVWKASFQHKAQQTGCSNCPSLEIAHSRAQTHPPIVSRETTRHGNCSPSPTENRCPSARELSTPVKPSLSSSLRPRSPSTSPPTTTPPPSSWTRERPGGTRSQTSSVVGRNRPQRRTVGPSRLGLRIAL